MDGTERLFTALLIIGLIGGAAWMVLAARQGDEAQPPLEAHEGDAEAVEEAPEAPAERKPRQAPPSVDLPQAPTLRMEVACVGPKRVQRGESFELAFRAFNRGHLALSNVTFAARGSDGIRLGPSRKPERLIPRLEPGSPATLRMTCTATRVGTYEVTVSAREERGWAAAGASLRIVVQEDTVMVAEHQDARRYAVRASLRFLDPVTPGAVFRTRTTFTNDGDIALEGVKVGWSVTGGVTLLDGATTRMELGTLPAGATRTFETRARAPASVVKASRLMTSLRDAFGWAATGAYLQLPRDEDGRR